MASNIENENEHDDETWLKPGKKFNNDRFEIIKKIGQGGFGNIYLVYDNQNEKEKFAF